MSHGSLTVRFPSTSHEHTIYEIDNINTGKSYLCDPEHCKTILSSSSGTHSFKILTQNIRSINCNIHGFKVLLARININFDLYFLTETWNTITPILPSIPNYDLHYTKHNHNQNDGLVIYTKNGLICTVEEPNFNDAICLTIKINSITLIIALYRSPSKRNITPFLISLDKLLLTYKSYTNIIIMGDINIDIKPNNDDTNSHDYLNLLASHGLLTSHTFPTRIANCLDHAMVKSRNPVTSLVLKAPLTDHSAVILSLDLATQQNHQNRTITVNKVNYQGILTDLQGTSFDDIMTSRDANWAAERLVSLLSNYLRTDTLYAKS